MNEGVPSIPEELENWQTSENISYQLTSSTEDIKHCKTILEGFGGGDLEI